MNSDITYRPMQPGEEEIICEMVMQVFDQFVGVDYDAEGRQSFAAYAEAEALRTRTQQNHFVWVALDDDMIVGVIEIRQFRHLSLFFVDAAYQGRGISRILFERALAICRKNNPQLQALTVNSSPYAVPIYRKLDFQQTEPEMIVNGIRAIPMRLTLPNARRRYI